MSLKLNSSGGGSVTLQEPTTASNVTLNLPAADGTIITTASTFAGTGPAFSAYASGGQSISSSTNTKLTYATESFDTNANYDAANSRFTPTVAGYYLVTINCQIDGTLSGAYANFMLWKNGASIVNMFSGNSVAYYHGNGSALVYMNGTTDYLESYIFMTQALSVLKFGFQALLVRAE